MAQPSLMSLHLAAQRPRLDNPSVQIVTQTGTGFVVEWSGSHYLITNRHVVTGLGRDGKPIGTAALPSSLLTWVLALSPKNPDGVMWLATRLELYDDDDEALWFIHPGHGHQVDVIALPLPDVDSLHRSGDFVGTYLPYSLTPPAAGRALLGPTSDVSIVGYPFGLTAGGRAAIWSRGTVASEPFVDFESEPCFLIDARTRSGQSGSPVIGYWTHQRQAASGELQVGVGEMWELHGVYSGLIDGRTDIGRVWKVGAIIDILQGRQRDSITYE